MTRFRTFDGSPVTGSISGFAEYTTEVKQAGSSIPVPVISPEDVLQALHKLTALFDATEVQQALHLLMIHSRDTNNPHHTNLDQFTQQVADVLYAEYTNNGGTGSRSFYLECLFHTYRIATLEEMATSTDRRLLISVAGAKQSIRAHELDADAHNELFNKILPGNPPRYAPQYALMAGIGISPFDYTPITGATTYVNALGTVVMSKEDEYPADYCWGDPLYPCFGDTTNLIPSSAAFTTCILKNMTLMEESEQDPMGTIKATSFFGTKDIRPQEHSVSIPKISLPMKKACTFSVYAKKETCRYLDISFKDFVHSDIVVHGVFDLSTGDCVVFNHMNRYSVAMQSLAHGWYRCIFTMYHEIGQVAPMTMTFFQEKQDDRSLAFQSGGEVLGYLWGMQYEQHATASPYIPTNGVTMTRNARPILVTLDESMLRTDTYTITTSWFQHHVDAGETTHPIISLLDTEHHIALRCEHRQDTVVVEHCDVLEDGDIKHDTAVSQTVFHHDEERNYHFLTHSFNPTELRTAYNAQQKTTASPLSSATPQILGIGTDGTKYLDSYIRSVTIYPAPMDEDNMTFLHGEVIYG